MKIVYIIDSLALKGGAERIITEKMNYLATIYNYELSHTINSMSPTPILCLVK